MECYPRIVSCQCVWNTDPDASDTPVRLLYLAHPALRSLMIRLHSQLNAFTHFVLSIDRPIAHPIENGLQGMPDPRATILAKANVVDVLGREGVDLIQWGKAIEGLPQCEQFVRQNRGANQQPTPSGQTQLRPSSGYPASLLRTAHPAF